jgi:hypothetical protein
MNQALYAHMNNKRKMKKKKKEMVFCFLPRAGLELDPPAYAYGIVGITSKHYQIQLVC